MEWYKRSKFAFNAFRNLTSKLIPKNPIQKSIETTPDVKPCSIFGKTQNLSEFSLAFRYRIQQRNQYSPFLNGSKRYYARNQVEHFGPTGYKKWFQDSRTKFITVLVGSGIVITLYFGNLETIPYTKRTHFIILSNSLEKTLGEWQFNEKKDSYKGKILPDKHPDSIRVRLIAKDIIEALHRGLKKEEVTTHLEGLNWEVIVVNEPEVNAYCIPGGKIVVFTGLLEQFKSNSEVAIIMGHEIAHAVARHSAEGITKNLWIVIMKLIIMQYVEPDLANTMSNYFLELPFSRRMEMEADYIGLLLIASAGYDPRVAPKVYEKLGVGSRADDYLSTHPSGKKRAKLLAQAKVMEKALVLYKQSQTGTPGVEDFL